MSNVGNIVKEFIEKNIDAIESNDWKQVFQTWYDQADEIWPDEEHFIGLIEVLSEASIEPDDSARQAVLYDEILYHMEYLKKDKFNDNHHVGRFSLKNRLASKLGYTDVELHNMMDEAAKKLGLRYTNYYGGGYTW